MKIIKSAIAGTLESSDLLVKVDPSDTLEVVITSEVSKQFGKQIQIVVDETLSRLHLSAGLIVIEDKGALDCVIRARIQSAVLRSTGETLNWSQLL